MGENPEEGRSARREPKADEHGIDIYRSDLLRRIGFVSKLDQNIVIPLFSTQYNTINVT